MPRFRTYPTAATRANPAAVVGIPPLGSLNFYTGKTDHARIITLPLTFGQGEFTFEIWMRGDETRSFGAGYGTTAVWANNTTTIYGASDWWFPGNFLIDGHNNATYENGTFSIQITSSGDVQWTFGDGAPAAARVGNLHGLRTTGLNVVDGNWHLIKCRRRWDGGSGSLLDLWVDGVQRATETSTARTDMGTYWDSWTGYTSGQGFWCIGGEKFSVLGGSDWEDYWGEVSMMSFWDVARSTGEMESFANPTENAAGLVGVFRMADLDGSERTYDTIGGTRYIQYYNEGSAAWTSQVP